MLSVTNERATNWLQLINFIKGFPVIFLGQGMMNLLN